MIEDIFGWRDAAGNVKTYVTSDFNEIFIQRLNAREYSIVYVNEESGQRVTFTGFREADHEALMQYLKKHWKKALHTEKISTKGWHWGQATVNGKRYCFNINGQPAFEIPLQNLSNVTSTKSDLALELQPPTGGGEIDQVVEIRFVVPQPKEGDAVEMAENLKTELLDASGLATGASDAIFCLNYKQCQMPHGRFEIQFYPTLLKLHGKSSDFTIPFDNINAMYMLPSPQGAWSCLILQLASPLRRGQTKYQSVIMQLDDKKEIDIHLNLPQDQIEAMQQVVPEIKAAMSAIEYELTGQVMRALTKKPLIGPSPDYRGSSEYPCFRCSQKITPGLFYPLANQFVFIPKPVIIVRFDEIASVDFGRIQGSQTRLFDFQLTLRNGQEQEFTSVDRQDLQPFMDFLSSKGLKIRNLTTISKEDRQDIEVDDGDGEGASIGEEEEESSDQDFEEGDEDEDEEGSSDDEDEEEGDEDD